MLTKLLWRSSVPAVDLCGFEVAVNGGPLVQLDAASIVDEADGRKSFLLSGLSGLLPNKKNSIGMRHAGKDGVRSTWAFVEFVLEIPLPPPTDLSVE